MSHFGTGLRVAALSVGLVVTAGCQSLFDFQGQAEPTPPPAGKPAIARTDAPTPSIRDTRPLDRKAIRRLQAGLARLGFRPGPVDGIAGRRTAAAVKRYRAAHRLAPGGGITPGLLRHLEKQLAGEKSAEPPPANLDASDFPAYRPGTTFVYSDGTTERVVAANGAEVQWAQGDGTTYTANRNFLVPRSSWSSDSERGTARISDAAGDLWPLRKGAEVAFSATVMVERSALPNVTERREESWRCRNEGRRNLTVGVGAFETLVLVCEQGEKAKAPELVRTWYYAKSIRHFVRFVEQSPARGTTRTADLVAVRPGAVGWPPIVRAALTRAVVHALDAETEEARMLWTSSGVKTSVTIEAKSRFATDDGKLCRRFVQIWSTEDGSRAFPAVACKTPSGRWVIPGLEGGAPVSLATTGEFS